MCVAVGLATDRSCAVILPTLNEVQNVTRLIPEIYAQLPNATVIVVDHRSSDGTAEAVTRLATHYPTLVVLRPVGWGLASAYRSGFEYAIEQQFDPIIQMDADGSHCPESLGLFLRNAPNFDLLVGSRYLPIRGRPHCHWSRRAISRLAQVYVRIWLRIPLTDVTSGYRLMNRAFVEHLLSVGFESVGYSVQIETAWLAARRCWRIGEVPIEFYARSNGRSKLSLRVLVEALWRIPHFRFSRLLP